MLVIPVEIKDFLEYNQNTGDFYWKVDMSRKIKKGALAGCSNPANIYWTIRFKGVNYAAHRLAWFFINNQMPRFEIDHIDGNRLNNKIENLRDVEHSTNQRNNKRHRSGYLAGVGFAKRMKAHPWRATSYLGSKKLDLGHYPKVWIAMLAVFLYENDGFMNPSRGRH